jgi:hypothetical protein
MADFLTPDVYSDWLSSEVLDDGASLERAIDRAERTLIGRYRGKGLSSFDPLKFQGYGATVDSPVQLDGWAENDDGTPDVQAMPDDLVEALRDSIAQLVEHRLTAHDPAVESESRGRRSMSYRARGVPPRVYAPLRQYDERTPMI